MYIERWFEPVFECLNSEGIILSTVCVRVAWLRVCSHAQYRLQCLHGALFIAIQMRSRRVRQCGCPLEGLNTGQRETFVGFG